MTENEYVEAWRLDNMAAKCRGNSDMVAFEGFMDNLFEELFPYAPQFLDHQNHKNYIYFWYCVDSFMQPAYRAILDARRGKKNGKKRT